VPFRNGATGLLRAPCRDRRAPLARFLSSDPLPAFSNVPIGLFEVAAFHL
jgi:hypothetical protein